LSEISNITHNISNIDIIANPTTAKVELYSPMRQSDSKAKYRKQKLKYFVAISKNHFEGNTLCSHGHMESILDSLSSSQLRNSYQASKCVNTSRDYDPYVHSLVSKEQKIASMSMSELLEPE
jgi:predicted esterase